MKFNVAFFDFPYMDFYTFRGKVILTLFLSFKYKSHFNLSRKKLSDLVGRRLVYFIIYMHCLDACVVCFVSATVEPLHKFDVDRKTKVSICTLNDRLLSCSCIKNIDVLRNRVSMSAFSININNETRQLRETCRNSKAAKYCKKSIRSIKTNPLQWNKRQWRKKNGKYHLTFNFCKIVQSLREPFKVNCFRFNIKVS